MQDSNVKGTPGDIKVHGWNDNENIDAYFDVSIVTVMAKSYVIKAAEKRGAAAEIKEKQKRDKYDNEKIFIHWYLNQQEEMERLQKEYYQNWQTG